MGVRVCLVEVARAICISAFHGDDRLSGLCGHLVDSHQFGQTFLAHCGVIEEIAVARNLSDLR
jgi:hypothetical protein